MIDSNTRHYFVIALCILLSCAGILLTGCEDELLNNNENTEQNDSDDSKEDDDTSDTPGSGDEDSTDDSNVTPKVPITLSIAKITATTVTFEASLDVDMMSEYQEVGFVYSNKDNLDVDNADCTKVKVNKEVYSQNITGFQYNTKYYYAIYLLRNNVYSYGTVNEFTTNDIAVNLMHSEDAITATTASVEGTISGLDEIDKGEIEIGLYYSLATNEVEVGTGTKVIAENTEGNRVLFQLDGLKYCSKIYCCPYVKQAEVCTHGTVTSFITDDVLVELNVKVNTIISETPIAEFEGTVMGLSDVDLNDVAVGVSLSSIKEDVWSDKSIKIPALNIAEDGNFLIKSDILDTDKHYYYCCYTKYHNEYKYGELRELKTIHPYNIPSDLDLSLAYDLSSSSTANCYIISEPGLYKFRASEGNSQTLVENVVSSSVLWETFGSSVTPRCGDLITATAFKDNYVIFNTNSVFNEGNAVVAVVDDNGVILWSWHIWFTDMPLGQKYFNDAGEMMDRNLGATSTIPGDASSLGLLYQWGRKDPFLGSCQTNASAIALSTMDWPAYVESGPETGTTNYSLAHPTTFIIYNNLNYDWFYTGNSTTDNTRWTTSEKDKSIYDPCPAGWRVPTGGNNGIWARATGGSLFENVVFDGKNAGIDFSGKLGGDTSIWYPAAGYLYRHNGVLQYAGSRGYYWTASPSESNYANHLYFRDDTTSIDLLDYGARARGLSVRCARE